MYHHWAKLHQQYPREREVMLMQ